MSTFKVERVREPKSGSLEVQPDLSPLTSHAEANSGGDDSPGLWQGGTDPTQNPVCSPPGGPPNPGGCQGNISRRNPGSRASRLHTEPLNQRG